jgi:hypothetical protein
MCDIVLNNFSSSLRFVLAWFERGKGLRPDWATKGIEFIYIAATPNSTKFLSDKDFLVVMKGQDKLVIKRIPCRTSKF